MCSIPTKASFIERIQNQQLKLKPHPKAHLAVPPGCCLGMLALTFSDVGELHGRNTEKSYPDSPHWQKVPQSYPDYLDKTLPPLLVIHALRVLGLEYNSVVEHLLHMNKAWILKKNPRKVGKERKEKENFCTMLCAQKPHSVVPLLSGSWNEYSSSDPWEIYQKC